MNQKKQLVAYFQEHRTPITDRLVALVREMVREKTINVIPEKLPEFPFLQFRGEEYRVAKIVKRELDKVGIPYIEYARMEGRPNVIGKLGRNRNGRRLLVPAHMDIVPAGDGWLTDPFEVVEKDGKLFGRGTLDNKGPLASILIAAMVLKDLGWDQNLEGELQIAALADEEADAPEGNYGIGYLLDNRLIDPTMAIVPDIGGNMQEIDIAEKGRTVIKITAFGKQAHGSTPEKGINAVYMMAKLVQLLENLKFEYDVHPVLGHPTMNLGEIHGGAAPNIVPGQCTVILDIRTVPNMSKEVVVSQLERLIAKIPDGNFKIEVISWSEPHAISADNEVVRAIQSNAKEYLQIEAQPIGQGGGTYAKTLNLHGITAVGWGPGDDNAFHVANEYIEIKQLVDFALMVCLTSIDLIG